ncbi:phage major tail tube protein [Vibrio aquimaris]|uniref:Phage tail tube protein FII n=1 Tax=Vibrio aquimaris TaxID=2587862 RepID=A0A5P9CRH1_9VIBR|nr:phage major tail tube protein [Vibrio aquimaris]QFT28796.1 Phage tail tube protein FII [Vibrio aquimaris]
MARTPHHKKLIINDITLTNDLASFQPPVMKKKMADRKGTLVGSKRFVKYEAPEWEAKTEGISDDVILSCLRDGKDTIVIYLEEGDDDGVPYTLEHTMTGETEFSNGESEVGGDLAQSSIKGVSVDKYRHTYNGKVITDFDIGTNDYTIGGKQYQNRLK